MRLATIAAASVFTLGATFAFAQSGGSAAGPGAPGKSDAIVRDGSGANSALTTRNSMSSSRSSGSAITTGSGAPQNKPNISNSPETSDTSQKVK
jgi:hypothetical protein